jgi:SHS family lactate transporter-like MFS transporter
MVVPNYALIQGVFIGCVSVYVIILALIGPENHGSHFENSKTAFEAGASKEDVNSTHEIQDLDKSGAGSTGGGEKETIQLVETKTQGKDTYV